MNSAESITTTPHHAPVQPIGSAGEALAHESAVLHVTGSASYIDDLPELRRTLHAAIGLATAAHARVQSINLDAVRAAPGVVAVLTADDIPGLNDFGPVVHDDPIFATSEVQFHGQALFAVLAEDMHAARAAARLAQVEYEALPAVLSVDDALEAGTRVLPDVSLRQGEVDGALAKAAHRLSGTVRHGGQDHFYLETHIAYAIPQEDNTMKVYASSQHPGEVQLQVAHALGVDAKDVVVECRRMGGGFGGKESQPGQIAAIAAIGALRTGRPVKLRLDRDDDMILTGKRHDFRIDWEAGFDDDGRLAAVRFRQSTRAGYSADLTGAIADRAMFHADNAYYLPAVAIDSHRCKTHTVSNTAFRGFGGPQGMFGIEEVIDNIARHLGRDPLEIRKLNYYGVDERNTTHYGQRIEDNVLAPMTTELEASCQYASRRAAIRQWNASSPVIKRGIALTPVKFGISFTATHLNQAGALLHVYTDGTVMLNHGGTEMGQGLFTKVAQVVARELQIDIDRIRVTASDTARVPNASATAASSGADLNGKAAQDAARKIKARLTEFAAAKFGCREDQVEFLPNRIRAGNTELSFAELAHAAWMGRVSLSATGYYRTPRIAYDRHTLSGRPFYYYAYGAACSEVAIDTLTGESRVLRTDILHDVGHSLNPAIDLGQVEGGFIQGMGWLTMEELWWDDKGRLRTHAPSTYKIPAVSDLPPVFNVRLWERGINSEDSIFRSKAVGEPPFMLALSVWHAIKDAIAAAGDYRLTPQLNAPATPEEILRSLDALRAHLASEAAAA
ncbi:xanthine dehydrogenase molybdopterin binding subunit [Parazoarcus communis]|uniref:Xanthine dehydrogenase molybdopterin binding subunit n=2 Tax=root TaxID=1 RepID=A0A323UTC5_9RHOO|nr:xanthine dehydrogenase molybdopterin binding subunit [Parazoarcus communis]NMG70591.1 xanthine dehydrogenase molybdopterin binding subunit [Parazoarcus communis SWub3 = DSM 12120]PZA15754.1 xanthine dehydrogenase molybdopterin binding subunit [Azoarcus communis] [Parazoarcus communis SWub3 = DSM 12120]